MKEGDLSVRLFSGAHVIGAVLTLLGGASVFLWLLPALIPSVQEAFEAPGSPEIAAAVTKIIGIPVALLCLLHAALMLLVARWVARGERMHAAWVCALANGIIVPVGTALAIASIFFFTRPDVRAHFKP